MLISLFPYEITVNLAIATNKVAMELGGGVVEEGVVWAQEIDRFGLNNVCDEYNVGYELHEDTCQVFIFHGRHWRKIETGMNREEWYSSKDDYLYIAYRELPVLNDVELDIYDTDFVSIISRPNVEGLLKNIELPSCPCCTHPYTRVAQWIDRNKHGRSSEDFYFLSSLDIVYQCLSCKDFSARGKSMPELEREYITIMRQES